MNDKIIKIKAYFVILDVNILTKDVDLKFWEIRPAD